MEDDVARRLLRTVAVLAALFGSDSVFTAQSIPRAPAEDTYQATIRRTAYGIPHISAHDSGSLGFGEGYAFAQDHLCSLADQVVLARGERATFFGAGEKETHLQSDVAMKALRVAELGAEDVRNASEERRQSLIGYAAGYNTYLPRSASTASPAGAAAPRGCGH